MSLLYDLPSESLANSWTLSSTSPSSLRCLHWACKPTLSDRFVQFLNNFTFGLRSTLAYFVVFSQISGFGNTQTYLVRRVCPCIKYFDITSIFDGLVDFCIFLLLNALFLFSAQNRGWSKWRHECGNSSHFQHWKASLPGQLISS